MQKTGPLDPVIVLVPPSIAIAAMWLSSPNSPSLIAVVCSYAMLQWAWGSYLLWDSRKNRPGLPVLTMISVVYWIYFGLPLFYSDRVIFTGHLAPVNEDYITETMVMALLAVACQWAGMMVPVPAAVPRHLPDIDERASSSWVYLRIVLVATTLLALYGPAIYILGNEGRNVMIILTTTVPTVAFLLLLRKSWIGTASLIDKPLLLTVAVTRVVGFLASGWMGPTVGLGVTVAALYILVRRKIPLIPIAFTVLAILFLQVGKEAYRDLYWGADADKSAGILERAQFWVGASASKWSDALLTPGGETTSGALASRTMERTSLLGQVAHVIELTPSQVPFQEGKTYSYLPITLIPRFMWPDKPSISEANQFYQVAFGLTAPKDLDKTSIAVGSMAEGYINFGWLGVILVMFGIGVVLRIYESACLTDQSNTLLLTVGVALLPWFLAIDGQLAQYIAGMLQNVFLTFVVFLPVTMKSSATQFAVNEFGTAPLRGTQR